MSREMNSLQLIMEEMKIANFKTREERKLGQIDVNRIEKYASDNGYRN